jgi:hypothetical protein
MEAMKAARALAVVVATVAASRALGIEGCLTPMEDLADRADVVVVGKIESSKTVTLNACPDSLPEEGRFYPRTYPRCGRLLGFVVSLETGLRGSAPRSLFVLVPWSSLGFLSLTCDDRPAPEAMVGLHAVLFLDKSGNDFWSVDGADGIYCQASPLSSAQVEGVRDILKEEPRQAR